MHLLGSSDRGSELKGLGSPDEIALFVKQQQALIAQAKREEAEQLVRHLKFDLAQRVVLLMIGVVIGIAVVIGAMASPDLLKLSLVAASAWGAIAAALYRWKPKPAAKPE